MHCTALLSLLHLLFAPLLAFSYCGLHLAAHCCTHPQVCTALHAPHACALHCGFQVIAIGSTSAHDLTDRFTYLSPRYNVHLHAPASPPAAAQFCALHLHTAPLAALHALTSSRTVCVLRSPHGCHTCTLHLTLTHTTHTSHHSRFHCTHAPHLDLGWFTGSPPLHSLFPACTICTGSGLHLRTSQVTGSFRLLHY